MKTQDWKGATGRTMQSRNKQKRKIRREEEKHVLPLTNHYVPMEPVVFRNQEEFAFHARVLYNDGQEDILADKTVSAVYGGVQGFPSILQEPFASRFDVAHIERFEDAD